MNVAMTPELDNETLVLRHRPLTRPWPRLLLPAAVLVQTTTGWHDSVGRSLTRIVDGRLDTACCPPRESFGAVDAVSRGYDQFQLSIVWPSPHHVYSTHEPVTGELPAGG